MDSIFTKIINKEISSDIKYEDDYCIAINDINPKSEIHILVIPKKPIINISTSKDSDKDLLGHLLLVCKKLAKQFKLEKDGYQILTNIGEGGGQTVMHLHFHLLSGNAVTL
tara:strand:- start:399 stop:731 length:333 start_codon:yes stop_codon:yes gene_type:complete